MVDVEELVPGETGENTMLHEAINALRLGNRSQARDLLTRLIKTDQKNPTYWVWLSVAVETQKERLYCLQTAIKADPQNAAAKRGLILLGGLPPDESVSPFPINHARLWEEKLSIPQDLMERKRGWANPVVRVFGILGIAVVILGGLIFGSSLLLPKGAVPMFFHTPTRRATVTLTFTPTNTPVFRTATPTFLGPTPLWMFLASTYTPTPLYVVTVHPVMTRASFDAGLRSLALGNFDTARIQFQDVLKTEPDAVDVYFYIGESFRLEGNYRSAKDAFQEAINRDSTFAPAFLGRARSNLALDAHAKIISDLNEALILDSKFAEAYIERGAYLADSDPSAAKTDIVTAIEITPDSALAYLYLSDIQYNLREYEASLESAIHANELDMTLIPVYLALARAYIATGQTAQAVSVLQTYTIFKPEDTSAFIKLGAAYNAAGDYEAAVRILNKAIDSDKRNVEAYYQRGTAYLNMKNPNLAETDFNAAVYYDPFHFDSQLGLARSYFMQGKPGNAYIRAEQKALPLARSDGSKAQVYYWEALFLEAIGDPTSVIGARNNWYRLIALPPDVMPEEWRTEAYEHLNITPTFTPTLRPTQTPTKTPTITP